MTQLLRVHDALFRRRSRLPQTSASAEQRLFRMSGCDPPVSSSFLELSMVGGRSCARYGMHVFSDLVHVTEPTVAVRVLDELRRCRIALDDDELARQLDVSPRQTIN